MSEENIENVLRGSVLNYSGTTDLEKPISNFSSSLSKLHKNSREEKIQLTFLLFTVFA